jgi:IstB-like ATP binding protein
MRPSASACRGGFLEASTGATEVVARRQSAWIAPRRSPVRVRLAPYPASRPGSLSSPTCASTPTTTRSTRGWPAELGPPGTGKTHLAIAVSIRACLAGQRVAFPTATEWVARLGDAKRTGGNSNLRHCADVPEVVPATRGVRPPAGARRASSAPARRAAPAVLGAFVDSPARCSIRARDPGGCSDVAGTASAALLLPRPDRVLALVHVRRARPLRIA